MSREAWQDTRAARNFADSPEPFLPPVHLDEDTAWPLFASAQERDFDHFLSVRNGQIDALDEELRAVAPEVQARLRGGMQTAVEQGYVPTSALERLEPAFTRTAIQAVDQSVLGDDLATYEQSRDVLTVATDAADYDLPQTIAHELGGHKLSGGTFVRGGDGTVVRTRRGFVNHSETTETPSARHYGLDEATQHHLILSYLHGQIDTVDPDMRRDGDTSYYEHRKLLASFVFRSGGIIDLKAITRGSFEDTDEVGGTITTDRRTMVAQARMAYGAGAYRKLSLLFDAIDFDDLSAEELEERIQAPELNGDGSVSRPGSIDVSGFSFYADGEDAWPVR